MEHSWAQENVWAAVILEAISSPWVHHIELGTLWIQSYPAIRITNVSIARVCFKKLHFIYQRFHLNCSDMMFEGNRPRCSQTVRDGVSRCRPPGEMESRS